MTTDKICCNIPWERLFSFSEVGYLKEVVDIILKNSLLDSLNLYIYFKTSWERWDLDESCLNKKTILLLVVDENFFVPPTLSNMVHIIFKHYLKADHSEERIFHLPVGPSNKIVERNEPKPILEREKNVFFSGNLHVGRANFFKYLTEIKALPFWLLHRLRNFIGNNYSSRFPDSYINFTFKFHTGLGFEEYNEMLQNSKIVFCPPGNPGIETMRHYEAMRSACIIISEPLPEVHAFKNSPIIIVNNWLEADQKISELLNDQGLMVEKQREMIYWWENRCNAQSVANYVVDKVLKEYL